MRKPHRKSFVLLSLLLMAVALLPFARPPSGALAQSASDKLVLAFYYMWYGPGSFDKGQMSDKPVSSYISDHPDVITGR